MILKEMVMPQDCQPLTNRRENLVPGMGSSDHYMPVVAPGSWWPQSNTLAPSACVCVREGGGGRRNGGPENS